MLRIIFNLGLVSVLSFNLHAEVKKCGTFTPTITDTDTLATLTTKVEADYKSLKTIYDCILIKGKAINEAVAGALTQAAYEDAIKEALVLENSCASYITLLLANTDRINEKPSELQTAGSSTKISLLLYKAHYDIPKIKTNAKTLASELYALAAQNKIDIPVKDKIADWKKDAAGTGEIALDNSSQLYNLDKILTENKTNTDVATVSTKLDTALKGSFTTDAAITDFKTKLKDKKYDVGSTDVAPSTGTDGGAAATTTTTGTDATTSKDKLTDILLAQYLANLAKDDNNNNNTNNNNNGVAAPVLTSGKDKNSGGGSGSLAGANAGSRGGMDDDERKEMIARAKEREKAMMRMDMQRALYGNNPSGKSLAKAPMGKDGSGGSSLRDLFAKRFDAADKTMAKKGIVPSIFGGAGNDEVKPGDERYRGYFKSGAAPSSVSSKDAALNNFTSMYETARLRALTEDADQEFAGRYIDLFLLVHTILDHEYRDKGKLIDFTEVISSPLGPKPYKQRP